MVQIKTIRPSYQNVKVVLNAPYSVTNIQSLVTGNKVNNPNPESATLHLNVTPYFLLPGSFKPLVFEFTLHIALNQLISLNLAT